MLFTSLEFFFFLPLVLAAFSIVPVVQRWAVLLFASYVFYGFWHPFNLVYLGAVTDRANFFFANCRSGRTMVRWPRPRADRPARATGPRYPCSRRILARARAREAVFRSRRHRTRRSATREQSDPLAPRPAGAAGGAARLLAAVATSF